MWTEMDRIKLRTEKEDEQIDLILRFISDDDNTDKIPQPMFIIGNIGSGKSYILKLLYSILDNDSWSDRLTMLDGKQFFSANDIIRAIEGNGYDVNLSPIAEKSDKRRIVMIDDLDYYFNRSTYEDQYMLRNYLNRENAPLLIASISEVHKSVAEYKAPFFEGVRLIYIPSLSNSVLESVGLSKETKGRIARLMEYLPPTVESLRIAVEITNLSEKEDYDLSELIKRFNSLYRYKFENMPVYSQKIMYGLARSSRPSNLSELRELTELPSGILSTYLRKLIAAGEVLKKSPERGAPYEITDKLFKLWLSLPSM